MNSLHLQARLWEQLAGELNTQLKDFVLIDAWVKPHQHLTLLFNNENEIIACQLDFSADTGLFFFYEYPPDKPSGAQPVFKELFLQPVTRVKPHPGNRSFAIEFPDSKQLVFKMYGALCNVILLAQNNVTQLLKPGIENDKRLNEDSFINKQYTPNENSINQYYVGKWQATDRLPVLWHEKLPVISLETPIIFEALQYFSSQYLQAWNLEQGRQQLLQQYKQLIRKEEGLQKGTLKFLEHVQQSVPPDEIGHIIMANLHLIQKGATQVTLFDFYRNCPIEIELKKELSAQDNAGHYYKKARNRKKEIALKEKQLQQTEEKLPLLRKTYQTIEQAVSLKELKPFLKEEIVKSKPQLIDKFRKFELLDFKIYVGRNAANNDILTLQFAHKDDLWLHAKGVSGSHVVVKHKPGKIFPEPVIQYAASLAAHYSSLAGAALVPVMYTQKKFVRKPKGAHAGQVLVEKEEVILVKPGTEV